VCVCVRAKLNIPQTALLSWHKLGGGISKWGEYPGKITGEVVQGNVREGVVHSGMSEAKCPGECADPMWNYRSLRLAVMICATLVNTQTHIETDSF